MHPDLEKLVRLQQAETALRKAEADLSEVPRLRAEMDGRLAAERARLQAAQEALAACQKARRQHEGDLAELETKRSKYKGQLMDVKTNKEYTAMLHEIETVEREIRSREDQILAEMESAESLSAEVQAETAAFKAAEENQRVEGRALDERAGALGAEVSRLAAQRDGVATTLAEAPLELFQRVARLRGSAVAEAREGMCQVCHVKLRPQMYVDLKRNEEVVQCPSCSRILFYEPPVPVATPQP